MKKAYEFIYTPFESYGGTPQVSTSLAIHEEDVALDELLEQFTNFLRSAGYTINSDQSLQLVGEYQEEDYEELWDEDEEEYEDHVADFGKMFESLKYSSSELFEDRMLSALDKDKGFETWSPSDDTPVLSDVTRVEVIDDTGRAYSVHNVSSVSTQLQDEGRTFKVFIK